MYLLFIVANLIMIPLGWLCIKAAKQILQVPRNVLMPVILLFCIVGAFAINNTVFDVGVMLIAGVVAYVLEENGFPVAPAILGVVLGGMLEENFVTSMIKSDGNLLGVLQPADRGDARRADARRVVPAAGHHAGDCGALAGAVTRRRRRLRVAQTRALTPRGCGAVKSSGFDRRTTINGVARVGASTVGRVSITECVGGMRAKLVVGNWKMNGGLAANARLLDSPGGGSGRVRRARGSLRCAFRFRTSGRRRPRWRARRSRGARRT